MHYLPYIELVLLIIITIPTLYVMFSGAPFVPTRMEQVRRMLKAAGLKKGMLLYDIGSGDGRLVHTANKDYGVRAIGYEYSPLVWAWSKLVQPFWNSKAEIRYGNLWKQDLSDADCIVCYLLPGPMQRFKREILPTLKPGTIIVSHAFQMQGIKPSKKIPFDKDQKLSAVWVYKTGKPKSQPKQSKSKSR